MSSNRLNTASPRVDKLNGEIDAQLDSANEEFSELSEYLDSIISVAEDRFRESPDIGFLLGLARLLELKSETAKKKMEIAKLKISDKANEIGATKKQAPSTSFEDLMSGAAFGAAVGTNVATAAISAKAAAESTKIKLIPPETKHSTPEDFIDALIETNSHDN